MKISLRFLAALAVLPLFADAAFGQLDPRQDLGHGAAGVERMRDFSWESVADRLVALYDEVTRPAALDATSVAGG